MLSLKRLKQMEAQPSLFSIPVVTISKEDAYEEPEAEEDKTDWYVPKKTWKQFFAQRKSGIITGGWDISELEKFYDRSLPKEIRLNAWTMINDVKEFVSSHLLIVKKYNGNKRFEMYLQRLIQLKTLLQ